MNEDQMVQLYVQYGWGEAEARADIRAGGWQNKEWITGSPTSIAQSGGGGGPFDFNWKDQYTAGFEKLKPYYDQVLKRAKGDLDLAKKIIESDYTQGMRETKTDRELRQRQLAMETPQETRSLEAQYATLGITEPEEREALTTQMNRRGISQSGIATTEFERLTGRQKARRDMMQRIPELAESQAIRKEVIERTLNDRELKLAATKKFGLEKEERAAETDKLSTGKTHETEASRLAESAFARKAALYGAQLGQDEASRAAGLDEVKKTYTTDWLKQYA